MNGKSQLLHKQTKQTNQVKINSVMSRGNFSLRLWTIQTKTRTAKFLAQLLTIQMQKKLGRCIKELERIYGIREGSSNEKGNNQYSLSKVFTSSENHKPHNQTELAESYGVTKQTMNNYMRMASMIPELEDLVDTGIVTKDTAFASIRTC